jgi:uncharacterized protein YecE (DUF72 family)
MELNTSFYAPVSRRNCEQWLERTAFNPDFRFTAKLWKRFTHERTAVWTADEVKQTRAGLDALHEAGRLGAVLVQFPWSFRNTEENRDWLDEVVSTFHDWPLVLEVRHLSWNEPDVYAELAERGIGFVNIDQPLFANSIAPSARVTSSVGYVRVHGRNYRDWFRKNAGPMERYDYLYPAKELKPWAERTQEMASHPRVQDVYVVTNNHVRGKGIANAMMLQTMLTGRKVEAPQTLVQAYPQELRPYVRQAPEAAGHPAAP